jgi:hypothetical protein
MKGIAIPKGVLQAAFGCETDSELESYLRMDCWGEGSCFFHSVCLLMVIRNRVVGDTVEYTLDIPNKRFRTFRVKIIKGAPFCETFRQVGLAMRKRLCEDLTANRQLWAEFQRQNDVNLAKTDKVQDVGGTIKELVDITVWADIWTIRYTAWRLRLNVLFVNPASATEPVYCGVENFTDGRHTIFIYWSNGTHFEPIVKVDGSRMTRSFGQNHRFIECLRKQYKQTCPLDPIGK